MQNVLAQPLAHPAFIEESRQVRRAAERRKRKIKLTRGERVIKFIESYCLVPEGMHVGQPVRLDYFQKEFILAVYDNPHVTDTAILSIARKNAKTGTIAFIVLAHLVGPEAVENSRIISGALSREQAAEVYNLAAKCVAISPKLTPLVRSVPSKKQLFGLPCNVEYQATSAEAKTAHGKSPILAILDEVGQIDGPQSDFVDAITTAQGAYENPLLIYISTQAATDNDLFSILIDDALTNCPPKTVCRVYAADELKEATPEVIRAQLLDEEQWRKANPALGTFRSMSDMRKQAEKAFRLPTFENTFRNLNLNQRISTASPIYSRSAWLACSAATVPIELCSELYGGLDLSSRTDLTAFVLVGLYEGVWQVYAWFWTPEKGLKERSKRDRTPYDIWVSKGLIRVSPNAATIKLSFIARELVGICAGLNVKRINYDRWRIEYLKDALEDDKEIGDREILPLQKCGQGFEDMSVCLDALDEDVLGATLAHGGNPVLTMCMANARVVTDAANGRKMDKRKSNGRIDGMQALAMARGAAVMKTPGDENGDLDDFLKNVVVVKA